MRFGGRRGVARHVAGGLIDDVNETDRRYKDTHSHPILPDVLALLDHTLDACPQLKAITYEVGVGLSAEMIAEDFLQLETILAARDWRPSVTAVPVCAV